VREWEERRDGQVKKIERKRGCKCHSNIVGDRKEKARGYGVGEMLESGIKKGGNKGGNKGGIGRDGRLEEDVSVRTVYCREERRTNRGHEGTYHLRQLKQTLKEGKDENRESTKQEQIRQTSCQQRLYGVCSSGDCCMVSVPQGTVVWCLFLG